MTQSEIKYAATLFEPMLEADRRRHLEFDRLWEENKGEFYHSCNDSRGSIYTPDGSMLANKAFKFGYCGTLFSPRDERGRRLADRLNDATVGIEVAVSVVNGIGIQEWTHPYLPDCGRPFIRFVRLNGTDDIFGFAVDGQDGFRRFAPTSAITQIDIRLVDKREE